MVGNILKDFRAAIESKKAVLDSKYDQLDFLDAEVEELKKKQKSAEKALVILQEVAKKTQEELEYRISELVTLALGSVFPDPYEMKLVYEIKRDKTEASIVFERGKKQFDPISCVGGGAVDIASFALRVALWSLAPRKTEPVLILDEPFRFVSEDLLEKAGLMLKEISKRLNIQIIMVSHLGSLIQEADKVFKVTQAKGVSKIKEV